MSTESCDACGADVSEYRLCGKCEGREASDLQHLVTLAAGLVVAGQAADGCVDISWVVASADVLLCRLKEVATATAKAEVKS